MAILGEFTETEPKIPKFKPVDPDEILTETIQGNIEALPAASELTSQVNRFNETELQRMLSSALPFYDQIKQRIGQNTLDLVSGRLPAIDVLASQRESAAQALYGGFGGTGAGRNLELRDLGLRGLQAQQTGMDSALRWLSATRAPQMNVTSMFLEPTTRLQHAVSERDSQFQRDYISNITKAQYTLGSRFKRADETFSQMIIAALGSLGGMMGGGA